MDKKIGFKKIANEGNFNELEIEKRELFLEKLQDFVVDVGLAKLEGDPYMFEDKEYDCITFYNLFSEDRDGEFHRIPLEDFKEGRMLRYHNKDIELLIIFFQEKIKIIFYANAKDREKILNALSKFVVLE